MVAVRWDTSGLYGVVRRAWAPIRERPPSVSSQLGPSPVLSSITSVILCVVGFSTLMVGLTGMWVSSADGKDGRVVRRNIGVFVALCVGVCLSVYALYAEKDEQATAPSGQAGTPSG